MRFLAAMLETVMRWVLDILNSVYPLKCAYRESYETVTVDFENYRHVCRHYKIAKALVVCLESKDFVLIRNRLIVLTKIILHFPAIQNLALVIEKRI